MEPTVSYYGTKQPNYQAKVKTREGVVINGKSFINIDKMAAVQARVQVRGF